MEIQKLTCDVTPEGYLQIGWLCMVKVQAIQVSIATTPNFTGASLKNFLLPEDAPGCVLKVPKGVWFIRVGAWIATATPALGNVHWSGIIGPFEAGLNGVADSAVAGRYLIRSSKAIENGYRLKTGNPNRNYMLVDISEDASFPADGTRSIYLYDWGSGHVDVPGLREGVSYNIRYAPFLGYPTNSMVELRKGVVLRDVRAVAITPLATRTGGDLIYRTQDIHLAQKAKEAPTPRFSSQADYLRYKTARQMH